MKKSPKIRIGIVEGNYLLRDYLTEKLKNQPDMAVAFSSSAPCGSSGAIPPDVILGQWEYIRPLLCNQEIDAFKQTRFVVINADPQNLDILQCINAGVVGFVLKDAPFENLADTIRSTIGNTWVVPMCLSTNLFNQLARISTSSPNDQPANMDRFTNRERQIIPLIIDGCTNKEIANKLCIAVDTVKTHIHNILDKSKVERRIDLLNQYRKYGDYSEGLRNAI